MMEWRIGWVGEERPEEFRKKVGCTRDRMDKVPNRTVPPISYSVQEGAKKHIRRRARG